jgi:guanylate kinase
MSARGRGEFAESAKVHDDLYGTLRSEVDKVLASGRHVIMDIDVQGARQFIKAYPESVLVFVLPPDIAVLLQRLKARGTERGKALDRRLSSAVDELRAVEMYHYVVVNEDIDRAVGDVSKIVDAEQMRTSRIARLGERVDQLVAGLEGALGNNQGSN